MKLTLKCGTLLFFSIFLLWGFSPRWSGVSLRALQGVRPESSRIYRQTAKPLTHEGPPIQTTGLRRTRIYSIPSRPGLDQAIEDELLSRNDAVAISGRRITLADSTLVSISFRKEPRPPSNAKFQTVVFAGKSLPRQRIVIEIDEPQHLPPLRAWLGQRKGE